MKLRLDSADYLTRSNIPLVTLKKYLVNVDMEQGLRRVIATLLDGMSNHAFRVDEEEYAFFKEEMDAIARHATQEPTLEGQLVAAGSAIQALENYNQRTARVFRRQGTELQKMVAMLTQAIITISGGNQRSADSLEAIKKNLEHAAGLEDVKNMKLRLSDCLHKVCEEALRQKKESEAAIAELQQQIWRAQAGLRAKGDTDDVTGLPGRTTADAKLREALSMPGKKYVAIVVLDRLQSINARFGNAIGDQTLRCFAEHLERRLQPVDSLFRWSGPAILLLMPRTTSIDLVRGEVRGMLDMAPPEFNLGGRSVSIALATAWSVVGLISPITTILKHLETFVAARGFATAVETKVS